MNLQAGDLRHKAKFIYDTSDGTTAPNWQPLFLNLIPAAKRGLTGRLYYAAAAAQSENDVLLTIRYSKEKASQIKPTMRVELDGNTTTPYEITSDPIDVGDRRKWLEIHVRKVTQNGA